MATSVLGLKTFAASDPVDYNDVNDNYTKIDNGVKTAMQGRAAYNYFVNSDLEYAVNQRGQTRWTRSGVYCIDMWKTESANDAASISYTKGSGITLTPTSTNYAGIVQKFENSDRMTGNVHTVAVCVGGTWECVTLTIGSETAGKTMSNGLRIYSPSGSYIIIRNPAGKSAITIQRVALYEGAYTADTLPAYVPKDNELAECERYHVPIGSAVWMTGFFKVGEGLVVEIPAARNMRINNPTVVLNNPKAFTGTGWNDLTYRSVSVSRHATKIVFDFADPAAANASHGDAMIVIGIEAINADL